MSPTPQAGVDLRDLARKCVVLTQAPEPLATVKPLFPKDTTVFVEVKDIDHAATVGRTDAFPDDITAIFGIGGGMALDHAKFSAVRMKKPLKQK